jgi:inosose dehydratase
MTHAIGTGEYPLYQWFGDEGKIYNDHLDEGLEMVRTSGLEVYEHTLPTAADVPKWKDLLAKHGLRMESAYRTLRLHENDWQAVVAEVVADCAACTELGIRVLVTNPEPINWNDPVDKSDEQLKTQALAMETLGRSLTAIGWKLGFHMHTPELRAAARELHHMMLATDPKHVGMCLDAHWIYRGAGNSALALMDILKLYGDRVVSLHLRQSVNHIWSETLRDGDVDYRAIARVLKNSGFDGPMILETAFDPETEKTMSHSDALRISAEYWLAAIASA